jgi:ABC-type proline/glycine betaine transport system permease subunit
MTKSEITKAALALSVALFSSVAFAQSTRPLPGVPGNPGDPGGCTALCSPDKPGDPGNPGVPGNPDKLGLAYKVCGDKLAQLRKVTVGEVKSITASFAVKIVPVCENRAKALADVEARFVERGNVAGLTTSIAGNHVLVSELADSRYQANDVIGIIVNGPAAVLYVHKQ